MKSMNLKQSNAQYELLKAAFDESPDIVLLKDSKGDFLLCNKTIANFYNTTPDEMVGKHDDDFGVPAEMAAFFRENVLAIMDKGETEIVYEHSQDANTGEVRYFKSIKKPLKDEKGENFILVVAQDVTELTESKKEAESLAKRLKYVLEATQSGIWDWNIATGEVLHNELWYEMLGYVKSDLPETMEEFAKHLHEDDIEKVMAEVNRCIKGETDIYKSIHRMRKKDGSIIWVEDSGRIVERDEEGNPVRMGGSYNDISYMKTHEIELEHIAHHDPLTNLPNRRLLSLKLDTAIKEAHDENQGLAIVLLDLDGFKPINDAYGHHVGDLVIQEVAKRIVQEVSNHGFVARLGGDEFVVVLKYLSDLAQTQELLNNLMMAVSKPFKMGSRVLNWSASAGISFYPDDNSDSDILLRHADQAMYLAKQSGQDVCFYSDLQDTRIEKDTLRRLEKAFDDEEFVLYYQPKVDMNTHKLIGLEALIRWNNPEKGILGPMTFLPLIEHNELSVRLGYWVLEAALRQMSLWLKQGISTSVSVNISSYVLLQDGFVDQVCEILKDYPDVNPQNLEFEILESAAVEDLQKASKVIDACRALSIRFSLDDFGTGYSSLVHLRKLSVDTLKIDREFVMDMMEDTEAASVVKSVVHIGQSFGLNVIAEGVESKAHSEALLALDCALGQGYGIGRPMPPEKIVEWREDWEKLGFSE